MDLEALLSEPSLARLRDLLDGREDVVVSIVDADLRVVWASESGSTGRYPHRRPEEYRGRSAADFLHPADVERYRDLAARAFAGESVRFEGRAVQADGSYVRIRTVLWPAETATAVVAVTVRVADTASS